MHEQLHESQHALATFHGHPDNVDERERAMGFTTGVTVVPTLSEASRRHVLGQAMDLNCLTWIVSLGMAEQRCLRTASVITRPLVSMLPHQKQPLGARRQSWSIHGGHGMSPRSVRS